MNLLILPQVFPPETHPTAVMVQQLARGLTKRGIKVSVACGLPHHPSGRVPADFPRGLLRREIVDGVEVIRAWHPTTENRSIPLRSGVMLLQSAASAIGAQLSDRPDVVMSLGPPIVGPLLASVVAKRFGASLVTVIFDIYPDVAINTGKLRNPAIISAAHMAERAMYRVSDRIVVLSDGFRQTLIRKGISSAKISVIPVWLDPEEIKPSSRDTELRRELGIELEDFVVLYAGTIGVISGAEIVANAASFVRNPRVHFVMIGTGDALPGLKARVKLLGLRNFHFLPSQPRVRLNEIQASADLGLVTLAPGCGHTSVPSKVLGYMAAGRPVLAAVDEDSDTAILVRNAGGRVVPPGNAEALASAIDDLTSTSLLATGTKAREAFLSSFTEEAAVNAYIGVFCAANAQAPVSHS